ncbi:Beta-ketoacyl synthase [Marinomonas sp. MED121]|uniref:AMP-binding protein n=1 Tax=Marinomonas sp. MED121 TaxID=314277 RepID=UPI000068FD2F|nr:AMP-binding protein [Marinomonas sp. MED121]EAQ63722.1 Beta-ketoacyl synthase [Marinomonas sp. MED121]
MDQDCLIDTPSYSNLIELLEHQVSSNGDKTCFTLLANGSDVAETISYAQLSTRARAMAVELRALSEPGDRAMLLMPNGIDYIVGFFGCIYAGLIAVTAYAPQQRRRDWGRLTSILKDADASLALCSAEHNDQVKAWLAESDQACHQFVVGEEAINSAAQWVMPNINAETVAYLQYSSGSTGSPKGVMLGHGNLIQNTALIVQELSLTECGNIVSWLPMYHDMGFVGFVLAPMCAGASVWLLLPPVVLQAPFLWLKAISDHKAVLSGGPNFIYEHCVARVSEEQKQTLDLSHWRFAVNGAEPIHTATLEKFNQTFAECGLSKHALKPCYGMAETCLFVTSTAIDQSYRNVQLNKAALQKGRLVRVKEGDLNEQDLFENLVDVPSSGRLNDQMAVSIVDPETKQVLADDRVGEIWIRGASVAQGYWNKPEVNAEVFNNDVLFYSQTTKDVVDKNGGYLRTGDLGFILDGWLYVSGRAKEVVIVNGRNLYPQDIEASVQVVDKDLAPHGGAVFQTTDNKVVLVQEVTRQGMRNKNYEDIILSIRQAVAEEYDISLSAVVLIKPVSLAKTTSGKIQRLKNRDLYEQGALTQVAQWQMDGEADTAIEEKESNEPELMSGNEASISHWICYWIAQRLQVALDDVNPEQKLAGTGLDSVDSMTLTHELSQRLNLDLSAELIWQYPTTKALATYLASTQSGSKSHQVDLEVNEEECLLEGEI